MPKIYTAAVDPTTGVIDPRHKITAAQVTGLSASTVGALAKPATPSSTQMVVLNTDGTTATQTIPSGGSGSLTPSTTDIIL